jgi:Zn-dependent peptidase ImmA (M78 family)
LIKEAKILTNYIAVPQSRKKLRRLAKQIRDVFRLSDVIPFPVVQLLEAMPDIFSEKGFVYEIVEDDVLPQSVQGDTDVANHYMRIKESVYEGACNGNGRDRFSITHEIAHYFLMSVYGYAFQRNLDGRAVKSYEDPEWQAECLAGELLVPYHLVVGMSIEEIADKCGVSSLAAITQKKVFRT